MSKNNLPVWTPAQLDEYNRRHGFGARQITQALSPRPTAPPIPAPPRERLPNQTEEIYRRQFLLNRIAEGEITLCKYEAIVLTLAARTTYRPDWACVLANGTLEFHEVKGAHTWEDAWVKLKIAAKLYPFRFVLARRLKDQPWDVREVPGLYWQLRAARGEGAKSP